MNGSITRKDKWVGKELIPLETRAKRKKIRHVKDVKRTERKRKKKGGTTKLSAKTRCNPGGKILKLKL